MSKPLATSVVKFANEEWQLATTLRASLISHALRHMSHLNAFTVASTRHIDEMRGILFDVYDARLFDLHGDGNRFAAKAAYFRFGSSNLSYCPHQAPVRIEFREDDYIRFQVCTAGNGRTVIGGAPVGVDEKSIVCSPSNSAMEFGPSLEQFSLRVSRTVLEEDLTILLGARPKQALAFASTADCNIGSTLRLREKIIYVANSIDVSDDPIPAPMLREMDRMIRISTLYGMPNNYSERLYAAEPASAPWQVKRVEEWIDAHWRDEVTIDQLAEVSGSSVRSIFATFKAARGYTPMAYLKRVRLHAARGMLLVALPGASVTAIGLACQFANLGHFACDYQEQFGELPSATLQKARALAA